MNSRRLYWRLCCAAAFLLSALTYLFGVPHTLWASVLVAVGLVVLTFIGTRVHPGRRQEDAE